MGNIVYILNWLVSVEVDWMLCYVSGLSKAELELK